GPRGRRSFGPLLRLEVEEQVGPVGELQGAYHVIGFASDHDGRADEGRDDELLLKLLGGPDLAELGLQRLAVDWFVHVGPPLSVRRTAYGSEGSCQASPASRYRARWTGPTCSGRTLLPIQVSRSWGSTTYRPPCLQWAGRGSSWPVAGSTTVAMPT